MNEKKRFSKEKRMKALGPIFQESTKNIPFLFPDKEFFIPITNKSIKNGDWLEWKTKEKYTSVDGFKDFNKVEKNRDKIYIVEWDEDPQEFFKFSDLSDFCQIWFTDKVKVVTWKKKDFLKEIEDSKLKIKKRNGCGFGEQLCVTDIFSVLKKIIPLDAYAMIAVTSSDLYNMKDFNFVFGSASLSERIGVCSFSRYLDDEDEDKDKKHKKVLRRICNVLVHELGHQFGLKHCVSWRCLMNGSNSLDESDSRPLQLCPNCLRKHLKAIGDFEIKQRYINLMNFCEKKKNENHWGFDIPYDWIKKRLNFIQDREKNSKDLKSDFQNLFK